MRAAQIENGVVVNFAEVLEYFGPFVDPKDAVFGSTIKEDGTFNSPVVTPVVAPVPERVTRRQARQALLLNGLLDTVQPAIDAIPDTMQRGLAQIEWDDSQIFLRERPLVIAIGGAIGLDAAGLDALFIQAGELL